MRLDIVLEFSDLLIKISLALVEGEANEEGAGYRSGPPIIKYKLRTYRLDENFSFYGCYGNLLVDKRSFFDYCLTHNKHNHLLLPTTPRNMADEEDIKFRKSARFMAEAAWKKIKHVTFEDIVVYFYQPTDPSSLGVIRCLFGFLMLFDLSEERGGSIIDIRWGNPKDCHFPLFPILTNPGFPVISLMYLSMWLGACGIMLGYKFRLSVLLFGVPYWYIFLLDKSFWNNHSYLFGVVTILLMGSSANHFLSIDGYLDRSKSNRHVPYWNYFILKYQFFMLYFLAGLKKTDSEWLEGYSVNYLGKHWVFWPFRLLLSSGQIDYIIIHWFGFLLDLTIGFWLLIAFTRPVAMLFCACFHLMNSRLFRIGMFPYVCLATMPLFCEENWPRKIQSLFTDKNSKAFPSQACIYHKDKMESCGNIDLKYKANWKHKFVVTLLMCHCGLQAFLPYSHFITKGYNNWTDGLYGYSWDMMVHSWDTILVVVKVVDNDTGGEHFIDTGAWTHNDRWSKHADMGVQYAECLKRNLVSDLRDEARSQMHSKISSKFTADNISIYLDVWCSLNKRFQQRMFDPKYDLLKANWSPFQPVEWLLPVLWQYSNFRQRMNEISEEVYSWSNDSDVLFIADFPGLYLENFISEDIRNVTLTILEGEVVYEVENESSLQSVGVKLKKGQSTPVEVELFHKIHTISESPSCYMYTFIGSVKEEKESSEDKRSRKHSPFPLLEDVGERVNAFVRMWSHFANSVLYILFGKPYHVRSKIQDDDY